MRDLRFARLTASYYEKQPQGPVAVWMPGRFRETGVLRARTRDGVYTQQDPFDWIVSTRHFQTCTGLGPLLGRLGITTELEGGKDAQMNFPHPQVIAERAAAINRTLPEEHGLPKVVVHHGATINGRPFLESLRDDTVLLADGGQPRPGHRMGLNALIAAHDIATHLASRLAMDPASRAVLGEQCRNVLDDPGVPLYRGGPTRVDELAGRIDKFVAPPNLGPWQFGCPHEPLPFDVTGSAAVLNQLSNVEVGGIRIPRDVIDELGELSVAHVRFLGEHVANLPEQIL